MNTIPETDRQEIVRLYTKEKIGYVRIGKMLGYPRRDVRAALVSCGVEIAKPKQTRYNIDEHAFDDLSTELPCYWLGFIYADGCVSGNCLRIDLDVRDQNHLEKFKAFVQTERPLRIEKRKGWETVSTKALFTACNTHLANRLKSLGILPDRPDVTLATAQIPIAMCHHFIRGYMGGDGSIGKNRCRIRFIGQEDILQWIIEVFLQNGIQSNAELQTNPRTDKVKVIGFSGSFLSWSIVNFLYRDATIWMDRKRDKIKHWPEPQKPKRDGLGRYT